MYMTVDDFITRLAYGQLKNTALVDDQATGEINPAQEDQIISLINRGLMDMYTRKKLKTETVVITFVADQNDYEIIGLSTSPGPTDDYFLNLIEIQAVPKDYEVIDENKKVFTAGTTKHITQPNLTTIRFTDTFMEDYAPAVDVVLQLRHASITIITDVIYLPWKLYEALILYVSGLYLSHMGGKDHTQKGDDYYGLYLQLMNDDVINNFSGTSEITDNDSRFSDRGFV